MQEVDHALIFVYFNAPIFLRQSSTGTMKIEHFAINVEDPVAMADWYIKNLDMSCVRKMDCAPYTHFLGDTGGRVMLEIYNNPPGQVPDYASMHPLMLHLAFVSKSPTTDKDRLIKAGAKLVEEQKLEDGSHLIMLRDPWNFPIQLCKRGKPMLKP